MRCIHSMKEVRMHLKELATERPNRATQNLDPMNSLEIVSA